MQLFLRILRMIYYQVLFFFLSFLWGYPPPIILKNSRSLDFICFYLKSKNSVVLCKIRPANVASLLSLPSSGPWKPTGTTITATYFLLAERILREKQEKEIQTRSASPSNIKAQFR